MPPTAIRVTQDPRHLARAAADLFAREASRAVAERGRFHVALAGGSTPRRLYRQLSARELPWDRIEVFWGDERPVPPHHPESNYGLARDALLSAVPIPEENIHRIHGEKDPDTAAEEYEKTLLRVFKLGAGELPRFDLVLLGIGTDGHTASLFPGSAALAEARRLVVATRVPRLDAYRITLTLPVLNRAGTVIFLVSGAEKAAILRAVIEGGSEPPLPAQVIRPDSGRVVFVVDEAAGRLLASPTGMGDSG